MKKMMFLIACVLCTVAGYAQQEPLATTQYGVLEGVCESGVNVFKGVPFAAPPVGENRWRAPQPLQSWQGVRSAKKFGDDPMQGNPFGDMGFDAEKKSEDCLYLNVWTPSKTMTDRLPVVIYFNGGGLIAGSGSEPRYSGRQMARHGIVAVTANYREGIFGFFSHPQLSKETSYKGSGNYGFMDQAAAIKWVYENIAAFGGDPKQITIVGESAGSMSVSALLVSPLTRGMIARAMASSGAVCGRRLLSLKDAEKQGVQKLKELGLKNIGDARKMSADELLAKTQSGGLASYCLDGYFFTEDPTDAYLNGHQQKVPLLVGRNSLEMSPQAYLGGKAPTLENLRPALEAAFGDKTDEAMRLYGLNTDRDVLGKPGVDFASDQFIAYGTWLFGYLHAKTSGQPVYRYCFTRPRPAMRDKGLVAGLAGGVQKKGDDDVMTIPQNDEFKGAVHSADIEYAMGTLPTNRVYDWQPDDYRVSDQFINYYANFIKTGNPNGLGLANWTSITGKEQPTQLILDVDSYEEYDPAFEQRNLWLMQFNCFGSR